MKIQAGFRALLLLYTTTSMYVASSTTAKPCNLKDFKCPAGQTCVLSDDMCQSPPCSPMPRCLATTPPPATTPDGTSELTTEAGPVIIKNPCFGKICRTGYVCKVTVPKCKKNELCPLESSCILTSDGVVKEGRCPAAVDTAIGICVEECVGDDSCPGLEKCCHGCPTTCRLPESDTISDAAPSSTSAATTREHPHPVITCASTMCVPGYECRDDPVPCEKAVCPTQANCHLAAVKAGACPFKAEESPCQTPHSCGTDGNCNGNQKCCGTCGKRCMDAVDTTTVVTDAVTTQALLPPAPVQVNQCSANCREGYECRLDPPQCQVPGCTQTPYCAALVKDCTSDAEVGPCEALMPRWYYNAVNKTCEQFNYGGCQGNANNYITETICWLTCKPEKEGRCPQPQPGHVGICAVLCHGDSECPNNQKCCNAGGGCPIHCVDPVPETVNTTTTFSQPETVKTTTTASQPIFYPNACKKVCPKGQVCMPRTIYCVTTPCPPMPRCVVHRTRTTTTSEAPAPVTQCKRRRCSPGYTCKIGPKTWLCRSQSCRERCAAIVRPGKCPSENTRSFWSRIRHMCSGIRCSIDYRCAEGEKCCSGCCKAIQGSTTPDGVAATTTTTQIPCTKNCEPGTVCELRQIFCFAPPCRPIQICKVLVKNGSCPGRHLNIVNPCPVSNCTRDYDCPGSQKCCGLCPRHCTDLETVGSSSGQNKPGKCLNVHVGCIVNRGRSDKCQNDSDCEGNRLCCTSFCRKTCMKPLPDWLADLL